MDDLKKLLEEINSRKRDVVSRLEVEHVRGKTTLRDDIMGWLVSVEKMNEEIQRNEQQVPRERKFFSRSSKSSDIQTKIVEVKKLIDIGQFPNGLIVSQSGSPEDHTQHNTTILGGEKVEEIWACLMEDNEARRIGVYGIGGIGKTTALKRINSRLCKENNKFDKVVWVTVSRCPDITSLQDKLAMSLDLDISNDTDKRAREKKLHEKFDEIKKYVLILDDLWEAYDLREVGIPKPSSENGCKLVLTTRTRNLCGEMECQKMIEMKPLCEDDALKLFIDTIGRHNTPTLPEMYDLMKMICSECKGLPLAIVTVAGSLRGTNDCDVYKIALEELRESIRFSKDNRVNDVLKFTFDRLSDRNLQECFMYCTLYPEYCEIERDFFIEHLIAEEIIKEQKIRQYEVRKGQIMLNKLVNTELLIDATNSKGQKCVMMRDLVREMALQMTTASPLYLVKAGERLKKLPDEECWNQDLEKVSLMDNDISDIPPSIKLPNCRRISTLLLSKNVSLKSISDDLFLHMKGLKVLDLSYNSCLENLPKSISELIALTALFLRGCKALSYLPYLATLKELKKLDLKDSGILKVPDGLELLINLRYLNLDAKSLKNIPDGILRSLSNLQYVAFNRDGDGPKLIAQELDKMGLLENFEGVLFDITNFNAYVRYMENLKPISYVLQLGFIGGSPRAPVDKGSKVVYLTNFDAGEQATTASIRLFLPRDVEILAIEKSDIKSTTLCELIFFEDVPNLRRCWIGGWNELEHLVSCSSSAIDHLQSLERLGLEGLRGFRGLIRSTGPSSSSSLSTLPPCRTFTSLKVLKISSCNNLDTLSLNPLPNLEEISVSECEKLVEITATSFEEAGKADKGKEVQIAHDDAMLANLSKLGKVHLSDLPSLENVPSVAYSAEQFVMQRCPKLKRKA